MQEGRHVDDAHLGDVTEIVATVFGLDDAGGDFQAEAPFPLRRHQPLLDQHGDGADGAVAAHRQAAAGLDEDQRRIGVVAQRLVEDGAGHDVVAARLEHQAGADPVVVGEEMLALLAHGGATKRRAAAGHHAHRIAGGMGIDAEEGAAGHA